MLSLTAGSLCLVDNNVSCDRRDKKNGDIDIKSKDNVPLFRSKKFALNSKNEDVTSITSQNVSDAFVVAKRTKSKIIDVQSKENLYPMQCHDLKSPVVKDDVEGKHISQKEGKSEAKCIENGDTAARVDNDEPRVHKNDPVTTSNSAELASDSETIGSISTSPSLNEDSSEGSDLLLSNDVIETESTYALETKHQLDSVERRACLTEVDKTKRYNALMNLLGKSNYYASYMSQILKVQPQPKSSDKVCRKRKSTAKFESYAKKMKISSGQVDAEVYTNTAGLVVSRRQPKLLVGTVMRDYQLDGMEWLVTLFKNAVNGILADEMGLGKTIQIISLICHLREKKIYGPHLIIAPLSTLSNWMLEFTNFAPDIPVMLYHGNPQTRNSLSTLFQKTIKSKNMEQIPVMLTSYEIPIRDKFLEKVSWCYTIVDEGHRLKNYDSILSKRLREYTTENRLLLTGTPLQNNLSELWALLNYLIPEIFDSLSTFENLFDFSDLQDSERQNQLIEQERQEQIITKMHEILRPFLLRRLKADVDIELPKKKEVLVFAPLTPMQETLYKATLDGTIVDYKKPQPEVISLSADGKRPKRNRRSRYVQDNFTEADLKELMKLRVPEPTQNPSEDNGSFVYDVKVNNIQMQLRKITNHPYLVKMPVNPVTKDIIVNEELVSNSGKLLVLDALLPKLKEKGHKVLLFSTFRILLNLIEEYVAMRGYKFVRLDGGYHIEDRVESIKQFNTDPDTFIFLVTTRAGGLGINLTAADTVILYDSDWNPQMDLQAQDRCHRIGQSRPVVVYRLITAGTVDQKIFDRATSKRRLEKLVVKRGRFRLDDESEKMFSITELQELLQSTDYKKVIHSNGLVLTDKQIDELLDRSDLVD